MTLRSRPAAMTVLIPISRESVSIARAPSSTFITDGADIIGLLCLQTAKSGGLSRIASSVSVFNEVMRRRPDLVPLLFEGFYWDREADAGPGEPPYFSFPICRYEGGRLGTLYIGWYIRNAQRFPEVPRLNASAARITRSDRCDRERSDLLPRHGFPAGRYAVSQERSDSPRTHRLRGLARAGTEATFAPYVADEFQFQGR